MDCSLISVVKPLLLLAGSLAIYHGLGLAGLGHYQKGRCEEMNNVYGAYLEAFSRCYPQKTVALQTKRVQGETRYKVVIDGDAGPADCLLTVADLRDATRLFNAGK